MANCDCCGCIIESDYGTSIVTGSGTGLDPYQISIVDTDWIRPSAKLKRTTTQSITPSGSFTAISFNSEVFDTGNFWASGAPTLITINEPGIYIFGGCGQWAANATGTRELGFRKNGTTILQVNDQPVDATSGGSLTPYSHVTYQSRLDTGNTLELVARQESGGSLDMLADGNSITFWIVYAGKTI